MMSMKGMENRGENSDCCFCRLSPLVSAVASRMNNPPLWIGPLPPSPAFFSFLKAQGLPGRIPV